MRLASAVFVVLAVVCCAAPAAASAGPGLTVRAVRAPHPLPADPALDDPAWDAGRIAGDAAFADVTTRRPAPYPTRVAVLYDDRRLYVRFGAEQSGAPILASQSTNNVGFGIDDFVGIGIDPGGSGSQVYYFETTPRATRYQQASENARYAPAWQATARIRDGGWDAVLVIPLDALRVRSGPQRWRITFIRGIAATGEHLSWAYDALMLDGAIGSGWPNFTDVRFWPWYDGVTLPRRIGALRPRADVYGLASAGADRRQFAQANGAFLPQQVRDAGVDVTVPLSETIAFVGTAGPDFSNVEVDQQTIAPQEFRRQLAEYRPFFAQGAAFLNPNPFPVGGAVAPQNLLFYSPSIGPFDRGAKVEGTHGNDAFGVLSVRGHDDVAGQTFDDLAFGFRHALPDRTFVYWTDGVLAHHSVAGHDATAEAGAEGRNLRTGFVWLANAAFEQGSALAGTAHSMNGFVDVHKPNYEVNVGYVDVSPHYAPLDGFTAISDIRGPSAYVNLFGSGRAVKNWLLQVYGDRFLDASGAVHQADAFLAVTATFKNGLSLNQLGPSLGQLRSYDVLAGDCAAPALGRTAYTGGPCYRNGRTDRYDLFNVGLGWRDGTPRPVDATYAFGPFGDVSLRTLTWTTSRPIARGLSLGVEYDGTWERALTGGALDSQFLRRVALGASLGANENVALAYRVVNGRGGFAVPGRNVSASFHRHFARGDELYLDFGTPAATQTLDRFIVKYVLHLGGTAGT